MELVKYQKKYFHLSRISTIKQIHKWCHIHTNCETKSNCHLLQHGCSCAISRYTKMYFFFVHRDTFLVCSYWDMNISEILDQFLYSEQWLWSVQKIQPEEFFISNQFLFVHTVTSQMLLLCATSCSKGKIPSLIFYKVELGAKERLFFLFQLGIL
jgi:hypothetical protein